MVIFPCMTGIRCRLHGCQRTADVPRWTAPGLRAVRCAREVTAVVAGLHARPSYEARAGLRPRAA
jgi:hypothetical protein